MRALRKDLLRSAHGRTVDIGSGTGLNLPYYPDDLDELILAEPDPAMRSRLEKRLRGNGGPTRLIDAPAERLPLPDESVDTVVSTFVLCTVEDPALVLQELARVLRRDGQLLFIEHVRSDSAMLATAQNRLARPWRRVARGCRCNRATAQLMETAGFTLDGIQASSWRAMPSIVRPLIVGRAHKERR